MMRFADIDAPRPTLESLARDYAGIAGALDGGDVPGALAEWDAVRRRFETWCTLARLRFDQNTADPAAVADRDHADGLAPEAADRDTTVKSRLLALPDRDRLVALAGGHMVRLWECDVATFAPSIKADLEEESRLTARYTALLASAAFDFDGRTVNLSGLAPFAEDPNRAIRHRAETLRWRFFAENGDELDSIYGQLVALRHKMATTLGFESFVPLAYKRMRRTDYGPEDVARFRDNIRAHIVPLVARIMERRRRDNGWDRLQFWDESFIDPLGNPKPAGDHDFLLTQARTMFDRMHPALGAFFRTMDDGGFMDLKNRPAKAGGGFCTTFSTVGMPFIFANFTGTHHDIGVFTHEIGHAFQAWESRTLPGLDYLWPTMEAAEIDSMSLEFLTYPHIGLMVGDDAADRFRRMHTIAALALMPYIACVDHFQHEVFAHPSASPAERHAMWARLERLYLPWTDYGDLAYPAKGGRWQAKQHLFASPFYYIDYGLAQCCALQFRSRMRRDPDEALGAFVSLCRQGGSAPFQDLVHSARLVSPFETGALANAARDIAEELDL